MTKAGNQLEVIARPNHPIGSGLADLLNKVLALQAQAQELTTGLANLRGSLRPGGFDTPEWLRRVSAKIDPSTTKVTTGLVFDSAGVHLRKVESGRDDLSRSAQAVLAQSQQFPKPPDWRPGDELTVADHVETKIAAWLRQTGISPGRQHVTVVINKDKPCGRPYGCQVAIRTILPRGSSLTVVSSVTGLRWTLKGVSP